MGPELRLGGEVRVRDLLLRRCQRVPQRPGAGEPESGRDLERVVESRVDGRDERARRAPGCAPLTRQPRRPRGRRSRIPALRSTRRACRRCRRPVRRDSPRRSGGSDVQSRASGCFRTFIIRAASATLIVCGPMWETVPNGESGYAGTRPKLGFRPTLPQKAAGMRTEPAPSVPMPRGPRPAATAAAVPPDDPPDVFEGSHGLRVIPVKRELVSALQPNSGVVVLPTQDRPGLAKPRRRRRIDGPRLIGVHGPAAPTGGPALGEDQVLDRRWHAIERAERLAIPPASLAGGCGDDAPLRRRGRTR